MSGKITYREILKGEEEQVCRLVMDCFNEFVAPEYSEEGIIEFTKYVNPDFTRNRLAKNHFMILALDDNVIIGVIEIRNHNHISLFFIQNEYQNKGIGKKLHKLAIEKCKTSIPEVEIIDVHSSPNAVPIYKKLGFKKTNTEQIVNGIRFTPMTFNLK